MNAAHLATFTPGVTSQRYRQLCSAHSQLPQHVSFRAVLSFLRVTVVLSLCCLHQTASHTTDNERRRPHDERSSVEITDGRYAGYTYVSLLNTDAATYKNTQTLNERNFANTRMIPFPAHCCPLQCWSVAYRPTNTKTHYIFSLHIISLFKTFFKLTFIFNIIFYNNNYYLEYIRLLFLTLSQHTEMFEFLSHSLFGFLLASKYYIKNFIFPYHSIKNVFPYTSLS